MRRAKLESAEFARLQRTCFALATGTTGANEIRVAGVGPELVRRQRQAANGELGHQTRAYFQKVLWDGAAWTLFSVIFTGGLALLVGDASPNPGRVGDLVLTVVVGLQIRAALQAAVVRSSATFASGSIIAAYTWLHSYRQQQATSLPKTRRPPPTKLVGGVAFENVSFRYPQTSRDALAGVSFQIPAGSVCAIVGESGSRKTTIVKLLCKLYSPDYGRILVDGEDLTFIDTAKWRSLITAAFQDFGRYRTTVRDNVLIGDLEADSDLRDAIMAADAERLVASLPAGLDTPLGPQFGGIDLSEGQWQKLALARALRPDAATAAGVGRADRIPRRTKRAGGLRTVHDRRAGVGGADRRDHASRDAPLLHACRSRPDFCLDGGNLIESGSHDELMALNGHYARLYRLQARAYSPVSA